VESVLLPVGRVHLAEHEVAAEEVVHDESGDVAVSPGRIVRMPGSPGHVVGGARVGGPGGAQCPVDTIERPGGHGGQHAGGHRHTASGVRASASTRVTGAEDHDAAVEVWRAANVARGRPPGPERIERVRVKLAEPGAIVIVAVVEDPRTGHAAGRARP
jgi:hypothetical protein